MSTAQQSSELANSVARCSFAPAPGSAVFRVQDKDGRGPWKPGFSQRWVEDRPAEEYAALVPLPLQFGDVLRRSIVGMSLGCGCRTLEQLRRWFTPTEYATLRRFGYHAVKMEAGRILAESDIQCVFERAKPLREGVEPVELYPPNDRTQPRRADDVNRDSGTESANRRWLQ